ncbi:MAG TPA: sec-independent translocase [Trebonia sp.]|nr:sec-independent translocase [Trebonia sp.]
MFDLSVTKLLVLAVIALVVFGPHELPKIAQQAGRALRDLRRIAEGAKADLREGLGPEFQDFDFEDLNPRRFVRKHLLDDMEDTSQALFDEFKDTSSAIMGGAGATSTAAGTTAATMAGSQRTATLPDGEDPPFDIEAT